MWLLVQNCVLFATFLLNDEQAKPIVEITSNFASFIAKNSTTRLIDKMMAEVTTPLGQFAMDIRKQQCFRRNNFIFYMALAVLYWSVSIISGWYAVNHLCCYVIADGTVITTH
uniref:Uncharacterized protein n=1 Tax=Parascaris univalens TaxID=6257 RepID=A0A915AEK9_PARUN